MREQLQKEIEEILREMGVKNPKVIFEYPVKIDFGDLSTNVAMVHAKELGKNPLGIAEEIKEKLEKKNLAHVMEIEAVAPGFLNFYFDAGYFEQAVQHLDLKNIFGGQKVWIEHTQPNPFKEFHIGHLMNNAIGESVTRIVKANGAEVKTASYHGDVGLHVAKAIWALKKDVEFNKAYAEGNAAYEENEDSKKEIIEINKKIYDKSDAEINTLYETGRKRSLDYFEVLYKRLGSHFDFHFYESETGGVGKKLVEKNTPKVFEKGDAGAVVFHGENFEPKTHTRVFLNSESLPTYEAKELGLAEIKKEKFPYDVSITVTANEQDSFFDVVEVAIGEVFPELKGKLKHISHGMLNLPSGKMSSRTGNVITAESLIDQVKEKIKEKMKDREMNATQIDEVSEQVAIGAIKYSILRQAIGGDIIFDFDKSISFEGDSGPYLQYSAVRANSLSEKAKGIVEMSEKIPAGWRTTNLERMLERFPSVVEKAGKEYAPHYIVTFLVELAGEFNAFYASHKIIDAEDQTSPYRLLLTKTFVHTMTVGLDLLGIEVPEKM